MPRWITRKTIDGVQVQPPIPCYDRTSVVAVPGIRTVEECVNLLLDEDEQIVGDLDEWVIAIQREGTVVGYLEIRRPLDEVDPTVEPVSLRDHSTGELHATLRIACNELAMLDNSASSIECSEEDRARIAAMSETEKAEARGVSMNVVDTVRRELLRRARESSR